MDPTYIVQIVVAYVMSFVLERLKGASWFPWLTDNSLHAIKVAWSWLIS